jgi:hypothetical protein
VEPLKKVTVKELVNVPEKKRKNHSEVNSKFKWWDDDVKFEKYYNPLADTHIPERPVDHIFLTSKQIIRLFKKSSFGKDVNRGLI